MAGTSDGATGFPHLTDDTGDADPVDRPGESGQTWLGGAGLLATVTSFVAFGDLPALLAAAVVAGGWYLLPHTFAFALGQVALVAVFSPGEAVPFLVGQAGLLGVLFAPLAADVGPGHELTGDIGPETGDGAGRNALAALARTGLVVTFGLLAGAGAAWASQQSAIVLPVASLLLVGVLGLAAYGLHRYQLVALGLVSDAESGGDADEQ